MGPCLGSRRIVLPLLIATGLSLTCMAGAAGAADRVYWTTEAGTGSVAFSNLDGSGGADVDMSGASALNVPRGVALDPAGNKIYVANYNVSKIAYANLDGSGAGGDLDTSGATMSGVFGIALDAAAGKVYWSNTNGKISFARVDGSGGADLNTSGATTESPGGVALDLAAGRIYWPNSNSISYANLDGSGGGNLNTTGATVVSATGVAIDPTQNRIFWTNAGVAPGKVSFARLDGSGGGNLNTSGANTDYLNGLAIDPDAGKVFWAYGGADGIAFANLDGSGGGGAVSLSGGTINNPEMPTLLKAPKGEAAPAIGGEAKLGSRLACSQGAWAADLPGSQLYRAPHDFSYQWNLDGKAITGETAAGLTTATVGAYTCTVTASNVAGASSQTSASISIRASNAFRLGYLKRNVRRGSAKLTVILPGPGKLILTGKGLLKQTPAAAKKVSVNAAGSAAKVKLLIKATGKKRRKLLRIGKTKIRAEIQFVPFGGDPSSKVKKMTLIRKGGDPKAT